MAGSLKMMLHVLNSAKIWFWEGEDGITRKRGERGEVKNLDKGIRKSEMGNRERELEKITISKRSRQPSGADRQGARQAAERMENSLANPRVLCFAESDLDLTGHFFRTYTHRRLRGQKDRVSLHIQGEEGQESRREMNAQ